MCNSDGSVNQLCDKSSGNCECLPFVDGLKCSKCQDGYYGFPECQGTYIRLEDEHSTNDYEKSYLISILFVIDFQLVNAMKMVPMISPVMMILEYVIVKTI